MKYEQQRELIRAFDQLSKRHDIDRYARNFITRARDALMLVPMWEVLKYVPGKTVCEKAERVGVSRNTWYMWQRGDTRPSKNWSRKLSQLTGFPSDTFKGLR